MQKIACVFSFEESSWVSCQKIVFNLHKAYQACPETELKNFNFTHSENVQFDKVSMLAREIFVYNPEVITILDHKPHPFPLIQALNSVYENKTKPKIIFHIFGDFSIYYLYWSKLSPILKDYKVEFVVASDRQKILLDRMTKNNPAIVCPFPVDPEEFYYKSKLRAEQRNKWNLGEQDIVYLFTGRLSRQKRIKTLVKTFAEEFKDEPRAHLYIYGSPDNIGDPFLGVYDIEGEYFRSFYQNYKEQPIEIQKRIHFMGSVPNRELLSVYQGADVLMNLSVHNDEDYGMSVAEAQSTGLKSVLTDWGGLASFEHESFQNAVCFVPVTIGEKSKLISGTLVKKQMRKMFETSPESDRVKIATLATEKFGIARAGLILHGLLKKDSKKFEGFSPLFDKTVHASQIASTDPMYMTKRFTVNKLFKEIYSAYVRHN